MDPKLKKMCFSLMANMNQTLPFSQFRLMHVCACLHGMPTKVQTCVHMGVFPCLEGLIRTQRVAERVAVMYLKQDSIVRAIYQTTKPFVLNVTTFSLTGFIQLI